MKKYIGIITAMREELEAIKKQATKQKEKHKYELTFIECEISNCDCILVESKIGKVNAARVTQILIDLYPIQFIISIGSAGSINPEISYGDIVIGEKLLQHDFDITAFGHPKGYIAGVGLYLESQKELVQKCKEVMKQYTKLENKIIIGTIASGDIFCTSIKMKEKIREKFKADCVEMESAAIAQVCMLDQIPFLVIRSISDTPNGSNHIDFNEYLEFASKRCAEFIKEMLK